MKPGSHQLIMASAGSGKTYQLCLRLAALLLCGFEPSRIVALTFTRKASGEFLSNLLEMLADGASDPAEAARLAGDMKLQPAPTSQDFAACLERVVSQLDQLNLGTLDSFFSRILMAFPFEFGFTGDLSLLEGSAVDNARERALREAFQAVGAKRSSLTSAYQLASVGGQAKQAERRINELVDQFYSDYLLSPEAELWGQPVAIWGPDGCPWPRWVDVEKLVEQMQSSLDPDTLHAGGRDRLERFFDQTRDWQPGKALPPDTSYLFNNAAPVLPQLADGEAEVTIERKKVLLQGEAAKALAGLVAGWIGHEIHNKLTETSGLHGVLASYDESYDRLFRSRGMLGFTDFPLLLARASHSSIHQLDVEYRLNAAFDHWLFDEFQDTSRLQWQAVANLIDEVVQDSSGRRSLFYVGDVKQSIFGWRGGDPQLFLEIRDYYNASGTTVINEVALAESWRSGPDILQMVNSVFGNHQEMRKIFPAAAVERWTTIWQEHQSAPPKRQLAGYSALLDRDTEAASPWQKAAEIIATVDPLSRGLSCAVILRTNQHAAECVEALRQAQIPALRDGVVSFGSDHPAGRMILHLLHLAIHPADTYAKAYVAMGPLGELFNSGKLPEVADWDELGSKIRSQIEQIGFRETIKYWLDLVFAGQEIDPFTQTRLDLILRAAGEYDLSDQRDISAFIDHLRNCEVEEPAGDSAIQVMTVHKAKGLGFDMVVLPDLEATGLGSLRQGLTRQQDDGGKTSWLLRLPNKQIAVLDGQLEQAVRAAEVDASFEEFCTLYVAMTRARLAMYAIAAKPKKSSKSTSYARWLHSALGDGETDAGDGEQPVTWEAGDRQWYLRHEKQEVIERPAEQLVPPSVAGVAAQQVPEPATPSKKPEDETAAVVPHASKFSALSLGSRVHEVLALMEWPTADILDPELKDHDPEVATLLGQAFKSDEIVRALSKLSNTAVVYCEQAFDVIVDAERVVGVIDRLVLEQQEGQVVRVLVQDFKTDMLEDDESTTLDKLKERHKHQMDAYRKAMTSLLPISREMVVCQLILLRAGRVISM